MTRTMPPMAKTMAMRKRLSCARPPLIFLAIPPAMGLAEEGDQAYASSKPLGYS